MPFFSQLFKKVGFSQTVMGIDFGTTSIKIVEIKRDSNGVFRLENYGQLENYGALERVNDAIQTSSMRIMEREASNLLAMLLKKIHFSAKKTVMTLPTFSAFITSMEFPKMTNQDLARAIPFQARSFIPLPLSETVFEWHPINPSAEEVTFRNLDKSVVLLSAISKDTIERYKRISQLTKLNIAALELEIFSCFRTIPLTEEPTCIIDIGACNTTIMIIDNLSLRQAKLFELAGNDLTLAIAKGLSIDPFRAELLKKSKGLIAAPGEEEYAGLMHPIIDSIFEEARKIMAAHSNLTSRGFKKIFLAGGSALLYGIREYAASQFKDLEVEVVNAFAKIAYTEELKPVIDRISSSFANACGAAMGQFSE